MRRLERVTFVPRHVIETMPGRPDAGLVTFHDPGNRPHQAQPGWAGHASFSFSDADAPAEGKLLLGPMKAYSVLAFVQSGVSDWRELFISCELGMSRSAAAALLFSELYGVPCFADTMPVDALSYRVYNRLVYRRLHDAAFGAIGEAFRAQA